MDLLIVEDDPDWIELIQEDASAADVTFHVSRSLSEALTSLEARRFNAALIDMSLIPDDRTNRDGEKVIRVLDGLAEGTQVAVLSGHTGPSLASKLAMLFGTPLIRKHSSGTDDLPQLLRQMVSRGRAQRPRPATAQSTLRGSLSGIDWEILLSNAVRGVSGGSYFLNRFLAETMAKFTPLANPANGSALANVEENVLGGHYWSRRHGVAVGLLVGRSEAVDKVIASKILERQFDASGDSEELSRRARADVTGVVQRMGLPRELYESVTWIPDDEESEDWLASLFGESGLTHPGG